MVMLVTPAGTVHVVDAVYTPLTQSAAQAELVPITQ